MGDEHKVDKEFKGQASTLRGEGGKGFDPGKGGGEQMWWWVV